MTETFNQRLEQRATELINAAIASHTVTIVAGQVTEQQYRRVTGAIAGLHEALTLIQQALVDCQKH